MFLHLLKYELKVGLRNKDLIIWLVLFPIVLGTFFKVAFGSIYEKTDKFSSIPVAVVEKSENPAFKQVLDGIESSNEPFLKVNFVTREKAEKLLDDGDVEGIIVSDGELSLTVKEKGLRETMLKLFVEQYKVREKIAMDAINTSPEKAQEVITSLTSETVSSCRKIPLTQGNPDVYIQYFYNLIAMVAMFGCMTGMHITMQNQADLSALGARNNCSPVPKSKSVLASLVGSFIMQTLCMVLCVTFLAFVLKTDFGDRLWLVYPTAVLGGILGVTFGFMVGSLACKNGSLEDGNDQDLGEWNNLLSNISKVDMTLDENYQRACAELDMQSFIDYFAAEIYWANKDWPNNNTGVWRANTVDPENPYADGKWRMVLFDTEYAASLADKINETGPTYNSFSQFGGGGMGGFGGFGGFGMGGGSLSGAFTNLMKNETFRQQFELSFMDMANYNFDTNKTTAVINYYKGFKQQILDTYKRFPSSKHTHNESTFDQDYQLLETFYNTRYSNVTSQMKNYMGLTGSLATVTVGNDGSKGTLKLNTIKFDDSMSTWSGKYFTDFPVTVKAEAKEGYRFDHWEVTGASVANTTSDEITVPVSEGVTIKAVYAQGSAPVVTTTKATTTTKVTTTVTTNQGGNVQNIKYGDVNCDSDVDLSDAVLIMQSLANPNKYGRNGSDSHHITAQGLANADCTGHNDGVTSNDAQAIQKYLLGLIKSLPDNN